MAGNRLFSSRGAHPLHTRRASTAPDDGADAEPDAPSWTREQAALAFVTELSLLQTPCDHPAVSLEKIVFAKIELWIVLLLVLCGAVVTVGFGAVVKHVGSGGEKAGAMGEFAYRVADVPIEFAALLSGKGRQQDYVSARVITAMPIEQYRQIEGVSGPGLDRLPIYWTSGATNLPPVAMTFRLNETQDEHLLILDGARKVVRHFPVSAGSLSGEFDPLIGVSASVMLDDTSIVVFANGSDGLYRKDLCGNVLWTAPGLYHHSYSVADGKIGILGLPNAKITAQDRGDLKWNHSEVINIFDAATGKLERSVRLDEIVRANAGRLDPFSWRLWQNNVNEHGVLHEDLIHLNKIELLPAAMADKYPGFPPGAWLLSSRNFNLLVVVHPQTLQILWHSQGHTEGQHDPEFDGTGRVLVFNNGMATNSTDPLSPANFSSIRSYDFARDQWAELYNAAGAKGFTGHSGEMDFAADGTLLMEMTVQGRYLEVSASGAVLSDFINLRDKNSVYWTKHAEYLTAEQFEKVRSLSCAS